MTTRRRLPDRRESTLIDFEHQGLGFTIGIVSIRTIFWPKFFCLPTKQVRLSNSIARDAAVVLSIGLSKWIEPRCHSIRFNA